MIFPELFSGAVPSSGNLGAAGEVIGGVLQSHLWGG